MVNFVVAYPLQSPGNINGDSLGTYELLALGRPCDRHKFIHHQQRGDDWDHPVGASIFDRSLGSGGTKVVSTAIKRLAYFRSKRGQPVKLAILQQICHPAKSR